MKILYVSTVSSTMNAFLIPHIKMLVKKSYQVDIAFNVNQPLKNELKNLITNVYELEFNRSPQKNNYFRLVKKLKSIIMEGDYKIVHTHTPIASAIVRLACKNLNNIKVIYTAHGFHFYEGAPLKNWLVYYPVEKILSKYTDTIITINHEDYNRALTFNANKVEYVPGVGLDLTSINYSDKAVQDIISELNLTKRNIILLSVGELNKNKNHKVVIEAISKLKHKNIKYIVCGSGNLKEYLIDYSRELGVSKQVQLVGRRSDIYEMLHLADIFIFPSYREGLSKALMEAMAMGKPIIASDIRGNKDLIDNKKGGLLFNPKSAEQLAKYIKIMLDDKTFRGSASNYNKEKVKQFSLENVLNEMSIIY